MKRFEKEIIDLAEIESILAKSPVIRIAMVDDGMPYMVPLCFGYLDGVLYIHGANSGKKISILKKNPHVCFECETDTKILKKDHACKWGMQYLSVIGFGHAEFVQDPLLKKKALDIIMGHYSDFDFHYPDASLAKTSVIKINVDHMTGKRSGV